MTLKPHQAYGLRIPTLATKIQAEIRRLEAAGELDPNCRGCDELYAYLRERWVPGEWRPPFGPRHKAGNFCQSGKRNHCTCDTCF